MNKVYKMEISRRTSGSVQPETDRDESGSDGNIFSFMDAHISTNIKIIFLLAGFVGLAGIVLIVYKSLSLPKVSHLDMVLFFGFACLFLLIMLVGLRNFSELCRPGKNQRIDIGNTTTSK